MTDQVPSITFPPGRLLSGAVGESQAVMDPVTKQPKYQKDGVTPAVEFYIGVAIPKQGEANWWETTWGQEIMSIGFAAWPQGQARQPDFAWKINDGDSTVPNKAGKILSQQPGCAGNWIINFKNGFAPKMVNADGTQVIGANEFYRGCWVQVWSTVKGNHGPNGTSQSPGLYLNHGVVALAGHGERIVSGPDASTLGFGQAPAPQGMSATPLATNFAANTEMPQQQMPAQGMPAQGMPQQQMPAQGMPAQGMPQQQMPAQSMPQQQMPAQGMPQNPYTGAMNPPQS